VASVDRQAVLAKLLDNLRRQDVLELEKKEVAHELGEALKRQKKEEVRLRDLLEGRAGEQTEIPGTEDGDEEPYEIGTAARRVSAALESLEKKGMTASVRIGGKVHDLGKRGRE
jgi:hypothetical protein